jgi:putative IMPACT (imprinted ancient) family translation regulator
MYAYRIVHDNINFATGHNDGGEKGSGERLSRLLEAAQCEDVAVVVSRWYGGVKLGSDRWRLISSVAKAALNKGNFAKDRVVDASTSHRESAKSRRKKK